MVVTMSFKKKGTPPKPHSYRLKKKMHGCIRKLIRRRKEK